MPLPFLVAAGAALAVKAGSAYIQKNQSDKKAKELQASRPVLNDSPYLQDQLSLAENELSRGDNTATMNKYTNDQDRDFANSLDAILKSGGDVNDVGKLFDGSQVARQRARLMSENIRMSNINRYVSASQNAEQQRQQQFQFNDWAPWADAAQGNAIARQQATAKLWSAVEDAGSLAVRASAGSGTGNNITADSSMPINSTNVGGVSNSYAAPSVAGRFNTIDPNALNNWNN